MQVQVLSYPPLSYANASSGKAQEFHRFLVRVRFPTLAPIKEFKNNIVKLIHFATGGINNLIIYNSIVGIKKVNIPFKWWGNENKWLDNEYIKSYMNLFDGIEVCVDYRQGIYFKHYFYKNIVKMFDDVKCIFPLADRKELLFYYWMSSKNKCMEDFLNYLFRDILLIKRVIKNIGYKNILFIRIRDENSKNKISEFLEMELNDFKIENLLVKKNSEVKILFEQGFKKHKKYIDKFFEIFTNKYNCRWYL